jgi:hypothetical protein
MNATINRFDADIKAVKDGGEGEFEAILSVPTMDRDGEVVDAHAFDPLPDYIPIDIDHGMSVTSTVGSGTPYYDGETLRFRGTFASTQLGQEVRTLVTEGHVRKMSVAFMSAQRAEAEDGTTHVVKAELLNAAIVAIPSNRESDILAAKALDLKATKAASLQQIHDLASSAGAECKGADADDTKSATEAAEIPVITDPEDTAAPAAVEPPAEVDVARALTDLALVEADLALE